MYFVTQCPVRRYIGFSRKRTLGSNCMLACQEMELWKLKGQCITEHDIEPQETN